MCIDLRALLEPADAFSMARNSEKGSNEHPARLDKNLGMLRERIAALLSDLRVPPRPQATAKDASEKQVWRALTWTLCTNKAIA